MQKLNLVCDTQLDLTMYLPFFLKHASPKSGYHPSMCSSPPLPISNMSKTIMSTSLCVPQFNAKERMVMMCIGSWIQGMPGQPVACGDMQKSAGATRLLTLLTEPKTLLRHIPFLLTLAWKEMAASQLPSSASESHWLPIHIVSSHILKQGNTYLSLRSVTKAYLTTGLRSWSGSQRKGGPLRSSRTPSSCFW